MNYMKLKKYRTYNIQYTYIVLHLQFKIYANDINYIKAFFISYFKL